jgi:hypothetical protein
MRGMALNQSPGHDLVAELFEITSESPLSSTLASQPASERAMKTCPFDMDATEKSQRRELNDLGSQTAGVDQRCRHRRNGKENDIELVGAVAD